MRCDGYARIKAMNFIIIAKKVYDILYAECIKFILMIFVYNKEIFRPKCKFVLHLNLDNKLHVMLYSNVFILIISYISSNLILVQSLFEFFF